MAGVPKSTHDATATVPRPKIDTALTPAATYRLVVVEGPDAGLPYRAARQRVLDELEQRYLERVLAENGGNVMRAAEASGIARRHLQRVKVRVQALGNT
jgi:hypothetical protein